MKERFYKFLVDEGVLFEFMQVIKMPIGEWCCLLEPKRYIAQLTIGQVGGLAKADKWTIKHNKWLKIVKTENETIQ